MHKMLPKIQKFSLYISKNKCFAFQSASLEKDVANSIAATLDIEALLWLGISSSNTSITKIIYHSLAGLNFKKHDATSLILSPTIQQFYSHPPADLCVKGLRMFHQVIDTFWADMMLYLTKPYDDNFMMMMFERYKFLCREDDVTEYLVYQNMFEFLLACHENDEAYTKWLFDYLFETSVTKSHWFWEKILEFVTHCMIHKIKNNENDRFFFHGNEVYWHFSKSIFYFKLLAPKDEDSHVGSQYLPYYDSEQKYRRTCVEKNLHFLMTYNLQLISKNKVFCHVPHLHQDCQTWMEIYLVYFENIDMWIDFALEGELGTIIHSWTEFTATKDVCKKQCLQLSILLLNSKKLCNKLDIFQLNCIIRNSILFNNEKTLRLLLKSLNETIICAFTKKTNDYELLIGYYERCLQILIYSNKSNFWYSHDIISVLSLLPLDQQLWNPANNFTTQLLENISDLVISSRFLDWYCKFFTQYLNTNSAYLPIISNSNLLKLMDHSLQEVIWKEFLKTIIEKYNNILYKPSSTSTHSSYSRSDYFKELIYLNKMKTKLNVRSTDNGYTLYAYISGEDIRWLKPLNNMHYAPYSIVFEPEHMYLFEKRSESRNLEATLEHKPNKLYSTILLFPKTIGQKFIGQDRTSTQKIDTQLPV